MDALLLVWLGSILVAGAVAAGKGRSALLWAGLGIVAGPLALIVLFLPSAERVQQQEAHAHGESRDYRACPACAELVRRAAVKCRHCGAELGPATAASSPAAYRAGAALGRLFSQK